MSEFEENFQALADERGPAVARRWYWIQVMMLARGRLFNKTYWSLVMMKDTFKMTLRSLGKNKGYSVLNFAGLVVGLICFLLISLYIHYEMNWDDMHTNGDQIHRILCQLPGEEFGLTTDVMAIGPAPLADALQDFPEVEYATRFNFRRRIYLNVEDQGFEEPGLFADNRFLHVFSFPLLHGDRRSVLDDLSSIVISRGLALKLFGTENAVGRTLESYMGDLTVTGIFDDIPENSHVRFDWIIPFPAMFGAEDRADRMAQWNWDDYYTYCLLEDGFTAGHVQDRLNAFLSDLYRERPERWGETRSHFRWVLQPLKDIHLRAGNRYEVATVNDIKTIRLFSVVALFILVIACINTMNLTSALAAKRSKEIGIRKVAGARQGQLFRRFIGESVYFSVSALAIALGCVTLLLPTFNAFVARPLEIAALFRWQSVTFLLGVVLLTGILSGFYPALVLASFKPVNVFRKSGSETGRGIHLRNALVLFQFGTSIILLIASFVIFSQINYIRNRDTGLDRERVVVFGMRDRGVRTQPEVFRETLLRNPGILSVTTGSQVPTRINSATGVYFQEDDGSEKMVHYHWLGADYNFLDALGIDLVEGRAFSRDFSTDAGRAVLVNETFLNQINWKEPVGKVVRPLWDGGECEIVGVVKDFNTQSLRHAMKPLVVGCRPNSYYLFIRIRPENIRETLAFISETYDALRVRYPLEYFFLDEDFGRMYDSEQRLNRMLVIFSGLAIFIACMGIFGLAAFTAERRTKEIGIRKALGATAGGIVALLFKGFTRWILIANLVAWPVAFVAMKRWLANYAHRIDLGVGVFLLSGGIVLFIACLAVSVQSVKAAVADPVDSLRYE